MKYSSYLEFFKQHEILPDASEKLESYLNLTQKTVEYLQFQQNKEIMYISRIVRHSRESMCHLRQAKQFSCIVEQMINLHILKVDIEEKLKTLDESVDLEFFLKKESL